MSAGPKSPLARLVVLGTLLLLLAGAGFWAQEQRRIDWFVAIAMLQGGVYGLAVLLLRRPLGDRAFPAILAIALLLRLIAFAAPVFLSTDINRYVWDGRVQAAGINPYRYVPNDPALAPLRDPDVWANINRATKAHTIYPPVAQMIFRAAQIGGSTRMAMKAAMLLLEAAGVFALYRVLQRLGLPRERLLIYLWHPLACWEIAGSGHVDAALIALIPLALWAWIEGRQGWAGIALAGATLVKYFPLLLVPALWGRKAAITRDFRLPLALAAAIPLAYLPYIGVGLGVLGYLPGYAKEEQLGSGSGLWLVDAIDRVAPLPVPLYLLGGGLLLLWLLYRSTAGLAPERLARLRDFAVLFTFFVSPHYAWYFLWLVPFIVLAGGEFLLWPTLAAFLLYWAPVPSVPPLWIGAVIYGGTALLALPWKPIAARPLTATPG